MLFAITINKLTIKFKKIYIKYYRTNMESDIFRMSLEEIFIHEAQMSILSQQEHLLEQNHKLYLYIFNALIQDMEQLL